MTTREPVCLIKMEELRQVLDGTNSLAVAATLRTILSKGSLEPVAWMSPDGKVSLRDGYVFHKPLYELKD